MSIRHLGAAVLLAALFTTGCATAPGVTSSPAAGGAAGVDPVGTYSFSSQAGGETFNGTIRITRAGSAYAGTISTPLTGDLPVRAVDVQGQHVRITADGRMGAAVMDVDMNGSDFTGAWEYGGSRGVMAGRHASGDVAPQNLPMKGEPGTEYAGNYDLAGTALQVRIFEQGERMMAQATGQGAFPLLYVGGHRFQGPASVGIAIDFTVADGRATGFALQQAGRTLQASRIP